MQKPGDRSKNNCFQNFVSQFPRPVKEFGYARLERFYFLVLVLLFVPVLLERLRERVEDVTAVILLPVRADDRPVGRPLLALLLDHRLRSVESPASDVFWLLGAIPPRHLQLSPHYLRSTAVSVVP